MALATTIARILLGFCVSRVASCRSNMSEKGIRDRHAPVRRSVDRYTRLVAQYQHQSLQARRSATGTSNFLIAKSFEFCYLLYL
jgi:hypothetical protein